MTKHFIPTCSGPANGVIQVHKFFNEHGTACVNASRILGGQRAHARTVGLIANLRESNQLSRHLKTELVQLHRLLTLDRVGNPDADETAFFVEIDPGEPLVEDICLLSDRLFFLLKTIA